MRMRWFVTALLVVVALFEIPGSVRLLIAQTDPQPGAPLANLPADMGDQLQRRPPAVHGHGNRADRAGAGFQRSKLPRVPQHPDDGGERQE